MVVVSVASRRFSILDPRSSFDGFPTSYSSGWNWGQGWALASTSDLFTAAERLDLDAFNLKAFSAELHIGFFKALGQFAFDQKSPEPFKSKIFAHIPVQKILVCQSVFSCISWLMNDITQGASHFESSSKDSQSDRSQQSARSQQQQGVHNTPLVVAEGGKIPWDHPTRPFTRAHWSRSR